jgi:hypothetical protein
MKRIHGTFVLLVASLISIPLVQLFATLPVQAVMIQQVMPQEARPGDEVVGTGYALDASHVLELYLVDSHQISYRAEIVEQMEGEITFRVPARILAGQMRLAVKVAGHATPLEQPVFLRIL